MLLVKEDPTKSEVSKAQLETKASMSVIHNRKEIMVRAVQEATENLFKDDSNQTVEEDNGKSWNDIVFENRNRDYGAYVLRQGYFNNVLVGLIFTGLLVVFIICYSYIAAIFQSNDHAEVVQLKKLVYTELSAPPPIDKPKPPPPQIQLPKLQKVIKFVPPKVVKEQIAEEVPTIEEIKQNETAAVEVQGTAVIFEEPVEEVVVEDDNELFTVVEQNPEFDGGYTAMMEYLQKNMVYPANARRMQIEGTVYVSFIVNKNGSISDVKVMRGIMTECDKEAVRVVEKMPPWKPGKQNGRNVNVRFTLPLKFRLH
jgi:protein TonB